MGKKGECVAVEATGRKLRLMAEVPKISVKAEIPDEVKNALSPTRWGKTLGVTPVVLTVVATMLAGLASSEMNRAQYERSMAAQRQSKAGDQWNFFQGKKLRGVMQRTSLDLLAATVELRPLDVAALRALLAGTGAVAVFDTPAGASVTVALREAALPQGLAAPVLPPKVQAATDALESAKPDPEIARLLGEIAGGELDEALRSWQRHVLAADEMTKPISDAIEALERELAKAPGGAALRRDFTAARLAYNAQRYDAEARLNQVVAELFDLQVRKSNLAAERFHRRSARFFYGMLAAQMGVIVSTLAIAAQRRNLLWAIAAGAGAIALALTAYVLLYV
ncbi:MAG: hypothetical protein JNL39_03460 [Opitutaceae bacterium]|nr:hypothetical protein [Opitutaceae bacterium]